jgi:Tfp pilus assembly protein FimT
MRDRRAGAPGRESGFSLIEMMVVAGIIMLLAAMAFPALGRTFRLYRIREAQDQLVANVQAARLKAISRNVNWGVSIVVEPPTGALPPTRYWIQVEDDLSPARSRTQQTIAFPAANTVNSTLATLPEGVQFATSAAECPNTTVQGATGQVGTPTIAFAPNGGWFRFDRLGAWCGGATCLNQPTNPATTGLPNVMVNSNADGASTVAGSLICVYQRATGLSRALLVSPGGRVRFAR